VRSVWRPSDQLLRWNDEHERRRRNCGKAEGIRGGADEDLRGNGPTRFFLVIDDWTRTMRSYGIVVVVAGEMCMKRLTVMMLGLIHVEMHVQERRADRACLHQHDESRRVQPAKHRGIVVKDERPGT
jgi:hypothetical protein